MKQNVRNEALETLQQIIAGKAFSNIAINTTIENGKLSSIDIPLFTELVYGTLQRRLTLQWLIAPYIKGKNIEDWVETLLCMSVYQLEFLDRVPQHAILNEAVNIAKYRSHKGIAGFVNGVLRNYIRNRKPLTEYTFNDEAERISVMYSYPKWLVDYWAEQWGMTETERVCEAMLQQPTRDARVNTNQTTVEQCMEELEREGVVATPGVLAPEALRIEKGNIAHTAAYREGDLSVQDESSMIVAHALQLEQEHIVLDCCAAPGGKTSHIAELLRNTGKVMSTDIHKHKVKLIEKGTKRLHLTNVETMQKDAKKLDEEFELNTFDRILVDAPCSGLGVIRRKPEIKYTKSKQDIEKLAQTGYDILCAVAPLLKQDGKLVYSTCTIDEAENVQNVERFLKEHPQFEWDTTLRQQLNIPLKEESYKNEAAIQILPYMYDTDGFFIARIQRKEVL